MAFHRSAIFRLAAAGSLIRPTGIRSMHNTRTSNTFAGQLIVLQEVQEAVKNKRPVVALESTIYTHGSFGVSNVVLANNLSNLVREHGAVPATCAVLDGVARVGLETQQLQDLLEKPSLMKVSRRDLAFATSLTRDGTRISGGTTISGTMVLAHLAGIKVFATGGLGGVHKNGHQTMDVSADLTELGRTPVAVISSGCKGFLDIPRTLEYLETQGVAVGTFADGREGQVDFPAFWSRDSGVKSPMTIQDEFEAATAIYAHFALPLTSGILLANPVPLEAQLPMSEQSLYITKAVEKSVTEGVTGAANTPFVLRAIQDLSNGRSMVANEALIQANVVKGARVAIALSQLERDNNQKTHQTVNPLGEHRIEEAARIKNSNASILEDIPSPTSSEIEPELIVAGSVALDFTCDYKPTTLGDVVPTLHTSHPVTISDAIGGVGYNISKAAHLLGVPVQFCGAVSDDLTGTAILRSLESSGLSTSTVRILPSSTGARTARYISVNDAASDLLLGFADTSILEHPSLNPASFSLSTPSPRTTWLLTDANWSPHALHAWLSWGRTQNLCVAFEPVSVPKSTRLFAPAAALPVFPSPLIDLCTPNAAELASMHAAASEVGLFERPEWWRIIDALGIPGIGLRTELVGAVGRELVDEGVPQMAIQLLPVCRTVVVSLGGQGAVVVMMLAVADARLDEPESARYVLARGSGDGGVGGLYVRLFPAEEVESDEIVSVNGAGDTMVGAMMAELVKGGRVEDGVVLGQKAAVCSLKTKETVSAEIAGLARANWR